MARWNSNIAHRRAEDFESRDKKGFEGGGTAGETRLLGVVVATIVENPRNVGNEIH